MWKPLDDPSLRTVELQLTGHGIINQRSALSVDRPVNTSTDPNHPFFYTQKRPEPYQGSYSSLLSVLIRRFHCPMSCVKFIWNSSFRRLYLHGCMTWLPGVLLHFSWSCLGVGLVASTVHIDDRRSWCTWLLHPSWVLLFGFFWTM